MRLLIYEKSLIKMTIETDGSYKNKEKILGSFKSIFNYISANKLLDKLTSKYSNITIEMLDFLCILKDAKNFQEYDIMNKELIFEIIINKNNKSFVKIGRMDKILKFLKTLKTLFSDTEVNSIKIRNLKTTDLL